MPRATHALALFLTALIAGVTSAAEYGSVPMQPQQQMAPRIASPTGPSYSMGMPSPQRPPMNPQHGQLGRHGVPQAPPAAGWSGYGFGGIPTYQWGYFGAHYRPVKVYHRGYYGHRMSHGYRRGY